MLNAATNGVLIYVKCARGECLGVARATVRWQGASDWSGSCIAARVKVSD